MSRAALRTALRLAGHWLIQKAGNPSYVVIYDDTQACGGDEGENYYGFFADPDEAGLIFSDFASSNPGRYRDVKLCLVVEDVPETARDESEPYWRDPGVRPREALALATMERIEKGRAAFDLSKLPLPTFDPVLVDPPFGGVRHGLAAQGPLATAAAIVVADADKAKLAMEHLRKARDLLKEVGATQTLKRVRSAIASADGAIRHAEGKALRPPVEQPVRIGLDPGQDTGVVFYSDGVKSYLYTPETCPSKHWNDGTDVCADCGENLAGSPDAAGGE